MEVIIATLDAATRAALHASLEQDDTAGRETAGTVGGTPSELTEELRGRLAARPHPGNALLIATGPALSEVTELVRLGIEEEVPVLIWPSAGTQTPRGRSRGRPRRSARLTAREREILALVADGASNKGIARALQVSPNTVKFHLAALFQKLSVATRAEAIAAAARSGELSL